MFPSYMKKWKTKTWIPKMDFRAIPSYSVSNFDFCPENETGVPHACTAPELCVATLPGILTSVRKKKQACPMHALHLSCV